MEITRSREVFHGPLDNPSQIHGKPPGLEGHGNPLPGGEAAGEVRAETPGAQVAEPPRCIAGGSGADINGDTEDHPRIPPLDVS